MTLRSAAVAALFVGAIVAPPPAALAQAEAPSPGGGYVAEFDSLWETIRRDYAYWEDTAVDWSRARTIHRPRAESARSAEEFEQVVADLVETLADPRARLVSRPAPPRSGVDTRDIWAEWQAGRFVVTEVREGSAADEADVEPGMEILAVNGRPVEEALLEHGSFSLARPDPAAIGPAIRALLADPPGEGRRLEVRTQRRKEQTIRMDDTPPPPYPPRPAVVWETLPEGFGYVAIRELDSLEVVSQFDAAIDRFADLPGLIVDLRQLPDGGSAAVVRGVLGRFVTEESGFARRVIPGGKVWPTLNRRWIELVEPRLDRSFTGPVVVLVGRWTAGEAEDIAVGLDALQRGTVVGTPMAGWHGETRAIFLPRSGLFVEYPFVQAQQLDGTPREAFVPKVVVDLFDEGARSEDDPVLREGIATLRGLTGGSR